MNKLDDITDKITEFLVKAFTDFLEISGIQYYQFVMAKHRPLFERVSWVFTILVSLSVTIWLIVSSYLNFLESPTVISERPVRQPVTEVPFPAIAICNENRISRTLLQNYSEYIYNATLKSDLNLGDNVSEVFNNLLILANLYNFEMSDSDYYTYDRVHSVLVQVYGGVYPINDIMTMITPKCSDMVKRCKWMGRIANCTELFTFRRTFHGHCCTFNYFRPSITDLRASSSSNIQVKEPLRIKKHGPDFGLVVIMDQLVEDYSYTMHSTIGSKIMVYSSETFADQLSNAIQERYISPGDEMFLNIIAMPTNGSNDMRQYSKDSRNCAFSDEIKLVYNNFYNLCECLLVCRVTDIINECGCSPPQYITLYYNVSRCLLADMPCLVRWKFGWNNQEYMQATLDSHLLDIHCPQCFSKCSYVLYRLESSTSKFHRSSFAQHHYDRDFIDGLNPVNYSILYVNFNSNKVIINDQTSIYLWFELIAYFGGLGNLTIGASIITLIELAYFFSGRFGAYFCNKFLRRINWPNTGIKLVEEYDKTNVNEHPIYYDELKKMNKHIWKKKY